MARPTKSVNCPVCNGPMEYTEGHPGHDDEPDHPDEWWCCNVECGHTQVVE